MRVIEDGLKPGEWVIVSGLQRVRPGAEVETQEVEEKPRPSPPVTAQTADSALGKQASTD